MSARTHRLKTWPTYFRAVRTGEKPFEVRWNDRDFQPGDLLELAEFDPVRGEFTGEVELRRATFVLADETFGIMPGYVAIGMARLAPDILLSEEAMTLTREQLRAWHAEQARNAYLRADGHRRNAESLARQPRTGLAVTRAKACEAAGALEAAFHAQAALLLGDQVDA